MNNTGLHTEGRRLLCLWLDDPGRSQAKFAAALGVGQPSVSLWVRGISRPEPHLREAIEIVAGIQRDAWTTSDERDAIEGVRARAGEIAIGRAA